MKFIFNNFLTSRDFRFLMQEEYCVGLSVLFKFQCPDSLLLLSCEVDKSHFSYSLVLLVVLVNFPRVSRIP